MQEMLHQTQRTVEKQGEEFDGVRAMLAKEKRKVKRIWRENCERIAIIFLNEFLAYFVLEGS